MKLDQDPRLPAQGSPGYERTLYTRLYELFRNISLVSNNNADGVKALNEIAQAAQDAIAALDGDVSDLEQTVATHSDDISNLNTRLDSKADTAHAHSTADISNLVGIVEDGAIIERGSNANGDYTKFADGTMICSGVYSGFYANASNYSFACVFPASFSGAEPTVVADMTRKHGAVGENKLYNSGTGARVLINTVSTTSTSIYIMVNATLVSGDDLCNLSVTAFGRWK